MRAARVSVTLSAGLFLGCLFGCDGGGAAPPDGGAGVDLAGAPGADDGGGGDASSGAADLAEVRGCSGKGAMMAGTTAQTIKSGGKDRSYQLHVPKGYDPSKRTPVVFAFHGYTDQAKNFAEGIGLYDESDRRGLITVAPQGLGFLAGWNAGSCCGEPSFQKIDDIGLVKDLLARLRQDFCVDDQRVYAMGFSNGSMFSHRVACELSEDIAAVGPVSGGLVYSPCQPKRPVSVMHFHGTADPTVPLGGGGSFGFPDIKTMIDDWAKRDGCTGAAEQTYQKGNATCRTYGKCSAGADVTLCLIDGGKHEWPGVGGGTKDIAATPQILDFFARHTR